MEAFKSLGRTHKGMESVHDEVPHCDSIEEYRKNVKLFIKTVTTEVTDIINHYQRKIAVLQTENKMLKAHKTQSNAACQHTESKTTVLNHETPSINILPLSKKTPKLDRMAVADSHFFNHFSHEMEDNIKFSAILRRHEPEKEGNEIGFDLINMEEELPQGRSHFQAKANRRKQHEADLVRFLQQGSKSMNTTTERYLQTIGRTNKQSQKEMQENIPCEDPSQPSTPQRNNIDLNRSLSNIFNSLDNSFIAKRSKSQKKDHPSSKNLQEALIRQRNEEELARITKSSGVKNLLLRLRENVEVSGKKQPQIIKCSKLITCGSKKSPTKELPSNRGSSKILINPVPVDIVRKSKVIKQDSPKEATQNPSRTSSPTKSILKQTSAILSKSIILPGDSSSDQF